MAKAGLKPGYPASWSSTQPGGYGGTLVPLAKGNNSKICYCGNFRVVTVAGTNIMYANKSIQAQQPEKKNLKQIARLVFAKIRA